jgi:hypothetical protein
MKLRDLLKTEEDQFSFSMTRNFAKQMNMQE